MPNLKVFVVNYGGTHKLMVATTSQKKAADLMALPLSHVRDFGSVTGNPADVELATKHPGMVMIRSDKHGAVWRPRNGY